MLSGSLTLQRHSLGRKRCTRKRNSMKCQKSARSVWVCRDVAKPLNELYLKFDLMRSPMKRIQNRKKYAHTTATKFDLRNSIVKVENNKCEIRTSNVARGTSGPKDDLPWSVITIQWSISYCYLWKDGR